MNLISLSVETVKRLCEAENLLEILLFQVGAHRSGTLDVCQKLLPRFGGDKPRELLVVLKSDREFRVVERVPFPEALAQLIC